tara:strand:- start:19 stop:501 length:483 start_codon:yes stop_codon:yes gene_type:complete
MAITKIIADSITSGAIANTPAFEAYLGSAQGVSNYTSTKVTINTENFDTAGNFNTSDNRFTPTTSGKYFVYGQVYGDPQTASDLNYTQMDIRKNGSTIKLGKVDLRNNPGREASVFFSTIITMNGSSDYVELWGQVYAADGAGMQFLATHTYFGAYRILT